MTRNLSAQRFQRELIETVPTVTLWNLTLRKANLSAEIALDDPKTAEVFQVITDNRLDLFTQQIGDVQMWVCATNDSETTYSHAEVARAVLGCFLMSGIGVESWE